MTHRIFFVAGALLAACTHREPSLFDVPPTPRAPVIVDASPVTDATDTDADTTPSLAEMVQAATGAVPSVIGRSSRHVRSRVQITETIRATATEGDSRYELVARRCVDLVPRGGSDCWDMGEMNGMFLRSMSASAQRWVRMLSLPFWSSPTLALDGDRVVVTLGRGRWSFLARDGSPLTAPRR